MKAIWGITALLLLGVALLALTENPRECDDALPAEGLQAEAVIAFSFGNRVRPDGSLAPGPVNQALGEVAAELHQRWELPIHAQWEIAETLAGRVPEDQVESIRPRRGEDGREIYLSTMGVIEQVVERVGDPAALGAVYVVAHRDHVCRCVEYLRARGFEAYAPPLALPEEYDAQSGQFWTRYPRVYRLVDRLAALQGAGT